MSKSARGASNSAESESAELPFEDALKRLEEVVESMETGDLPLDKLMKQYEEGSRLVALCQKRLAEAEQKMAQIERKADGEIVVKPLRLEEGSSS
ncbi:MAG: exodeoxyribonuclease VII small subunit [Verrucomicrobia bacterium]|nr:exodeoxyribonuclease VII small subunit [Verrucomicrobiota bacterium]